MAVERNQRRLDLALETCSTCPKLCRSRCPVARNETPAVNVSYGKGLDVGTANLLAATQDAHGNVLVKSQRNAFIDIEQNDFTRNMLTRMGVQYVILSGKTFR